MLDDRGPLAFKLDPYECSTDQDAGTPGRMPVWVTGSVPLGVGIAIDLGRQGLPAAQIDDHEDIGMGSRALCFAERKRETAERCGCGAPGNPHGRRHRNRPMPLNADPNIPDPDGLCAALIGAHEDLSDMAGTAFNARPALHSVNRTGDRAVPRDALKSAASTR